MNQPQGSVLGPTLRYVYINDLQLVPELTTYADDSTLSINYNKESEAVMARMNNTLEPIAAWGKQWHSRFATEIKIKHWSSYVHLELRLALTVKLS